MARITTSWMVRTGAKLALAAVVLAVGMKFPGLLGASDEAEAARTQAPAKPKAVEPVAVAKATSVPAAPVPTLATADDPTVVKRVLKIDGPFRHGDFVWDDKGVPPGRVIITVDLEAQTLSVFRGGYEIGAAVILYGADNMMTPLGTFPILEKDADHFSSTYDNAPMPYMLRLTRDGVAIHGSDVQLGNATHGCVGVPTAFAKLLFGQAKVGDLVVVTRGKRLGA
jgi:hypothetical protein